METALHLWATCATARQSARAERFSLCPAGTSPGSTDAHPRPLTPPRTAVKIPALTTPSRRAPQSHPCSHLNKPRFFSLPPSWGLPPNLDQLEVVFQMQSDKCREGGVSTSLCPGHLNTHRDVAGLPFSAHFNQIAHI